MVIASISMLPLVSGPFRQGPLPAVRCVVALGSSFRAPFPASQWSACAFACVCVFHGLFRANLAHGCSHCEVFRHFPWRVAAFPSVSSAFSCIVLHGALPFERRVCAVLWLLLGGGLWFSLALSRPGVELIAHVANNKP